MLLILHPDTDENSEAYQKTWAYLQNLEGVTAKPHVVQGQLQKLTEIYLVGDTHTLDKESFEALPAVERVVRISDEYRILGRHSDDQRLAGFNYNGVSFSQDNLNVFAGLCAVDNPEHVEIMMKALHATAQGVIAGANMVLVDFHPKPEEALVDGPQALHMNELERYLADIDIVQEAYLQRKALWQ